MNANEVLLRRGKVMVPMSARQPNPGLAASLNQNLAALGYTLAPDAVEAVARLEVDQAGRFYKEVTTKLRQLRGVQRFEPMYPNFPQQIMEASDAELYINALMHYFSAWAADLTGRQELVWLPRYRKQKRMVLDEEAERVEYKVLQLAHATDLAEIANQIVLANTSISPADATDLKWLISNGHWVIPEAIPNKETLALVGSLVMRQTTALPEYESMVVKSLSPLFKTATDVLRLAAVLSDGDASLASATKFGPYSRPERRVLLSLLEQVDGLMRLEDMQRWPERWLRLAERLHPGEFAARFPQSFASLNALRHKLRVRSFHSKVEAAVRGGAVETAIELLNTRPGEFARRLDHLLRQAGAESDLVLENFGEVAQRVSTPVLLQVMAHFRHRESSDLRVVFPKGQTAKVRALENKLAALEPKVAPWVTRICQAALIKRFALLEPLGRVWVDPELDNYLVPFSQRSAAPGLRLLERGSQIRFGAPWQPGEPVWDVSGKTVRQNTLRFFIWWKNSEQRTDLDLSAIMYDADWRYKEHISYFNLRSEAYRAYHSGDITDAPRGACEFIDIDMPSLAQHGGRYVAMTVHSFTRNRFASLPECWAGWMLRAQPQSGEVFDPRTVTDRIDVRSDSTQVMPLLIDVLERRVIWADVAIKANAGRGRPWGNNIANNADSITLIGRALTEIQKPNLGELFRLHAAARGSLIDDPAEADTVFGVEAGTPFELNRIAAEFLADPVREPVAVLKSD